MTDNYATSLEIRKKTRHYVKLIASIKTLLLFLSSDGVVVRLLHVFVITYGVVA